MISTILIFIAALYATMLVTWTFYLALMSVKKEYERLKKENKDFTIYQKVFLIPMAFLGYISDVCMNLFVGTVSFFELPKELLFTSRCQRHLNKDNRQGKVARFFCKEYLDPYDDGGHC